MLDNQAKRRKVSFADRWIRTDKNLEMRENMAFGGNYKEFVLT